MYYANKTMRHAPLFGNVAAVLAIVLIRTMPAHAALGDIVIQREALGSTLRVQTSAQMGGSVTSIVFRNKEYVDAFDHGRELQSASSFDNFGECFNPTEAGSHSDARGPTSSSNVIAVRSGSDWLETKTDMAFWLAPNWNYGRQCGKRPEVTHSVNKGVRGGHIFEKHLHLGEAGQPNVMSDRVTYIVPEAHESGTFEAATIYTPVDFSQRYVFDVDKRRTDITKIEGEQALPVILATPDGMHAVGIFSPALPQGGLGYGSFTFPTTNKLNCVYREKFIAAGQRFSYECDFAFGTLEEVKASILKLREHAHEHTKG